MIHLTSGRHGGMITCKPMFLAIALLLITVQARAQNATELWTRGYSVVPAPRTVRLVDGDVVFDGQPADQARRLVRPETG